MTTHCENPNCDNEGYKQVPLSVNKPSDERRTLCAICEDAYTWGVQHGHMEEYATKVAHQHVTTFLDDGDFLVLAKNRTDPWPGSPIEVWAYEGPLDFNVATPVRFGEPRPKPTHRAAFRADARPLLPSALLDTVAVVLPVP